MTSQSQMIADALRRNLPQSSEVTLTDDELTVTHFEEHGGERVLASMESVACDVLTGAPPEIDACALAYARLQGEGHIGLLGKLASVLGHPTLRTVDEFADAMRDDAWMLAAEQERDPSWWEGFEGDFAMANQAAGLGNFLVLGRLLAANPNLAAERSDAGFTLVHQVAERCDGYLAQAWERSLDLLVAHGADVNAANDDGNRPLHIARAEMIAPLIRCGAAVDAPNAAGQTALIALACESDATDAMRALIAAGANVDARDEQGCTAADYARERGETDKLELLSR